MKILVISDTHIQTIKGNFPSKLLEELKSSDACIHAGDFVEYSVFKELSSITKVYGVWGNMDSTGVRKNLPQKQIIRIGNIKIALTHGEGAPHSLITLIKDIFKDEFSEIDIFIFGHSHYPLNKIIDKKVYFNPGSPTDKIFTPYNSYGVIEIIGNVLKRRIVKIG